MHASPDLFALLRLEVGRFREHERRRRFDLMVHVGSIGGERVSVTIPAKQRGQLDRQVRVELASALLEVAPDAAHAWVTRAGTPDPDDSDVGWLVAADSAFGAAGVRLEGFWALTRTGWLDVRTGERRIWKRLRLRR